MQSIVGKESISAKMAGLLPCSGLFDSEKEKFLLEGKDYSVDVVNSASSNASTDHEASLLSIRDFDSPAFENSTYKW